MAETAAMPWPGFWKIIPGVAGQLRIDDFDVAVVPPADADACYVSVVGDNPVSVAFGETRRKYEEGMILQPNQAPFFIPFAEQMWFSVREGGAPDVVTVLWLKSRLRPTEP
jgi:hypothetical protein